MEANNSGNEVAGALTYPDRDDENVETVPIQPRQPINLQGLLRFAMEATKREDAPGTSGFRRMDEERRAFLEEALNSMSVDVPKLLKDAVKILSDPEKINSIQMDQDPPDDVAAAFFNIQEFICDIDVANDFHKIGGFSIFPVCLSSQNATVRIEAVSILAEMCQNNPYGQARALDANLMQVVVQLANTEEGNFLVTCLYAISCMCRGYGPACDELFANGGGPLLSELVRNSNIRVRTKAAFLVSFLAINHRSAKEIFLENNVIGNIAESLNRGIDCSTSCTLHALHALLQGPKLPPQVNDPTIKLKNVLVKLQNTKEIEYAEYSDERKVLKNIMKILKDVPTIEDADDEEADR
ncbi:PREDICTED: hsp70-binding protein 1 [Papilio xuthus]|uniref:Hsp70 nucleotide exchange factor FES1 n=1 Tax=Papilio xuthus TaxID=66420 RepID=I4DKG5_PAPXU|nr:hsp70-binding protein 1 [Papilio xuthus]KPI99029.1 Hsp70 nucleotide exchange factor FES1 [Papilio xuthus]BAM18405.1 unknown unsecreted protein [Papilio xuthus]